jgi:PAS domain S-box-containing protein
MDIMKLNDQDSLDDINEIAQLPLELFFSALKATVDAVVIATVKGKILWVNNAFEQLTGYCYQEALGQDTRLLKSGRQSDQFYQNMWNTLNSAKVWQGELWNRKKDGSLYFEDQTITPVINNGIITHYVAIKRDISEKVAIKKQLEHAEKMDAIGQIVGGISHNFNNKLANILGYNELATELLNELIDEQAVNEAPANEKASNENTSNKSSADEKSAQHKLSNYLDKIHLAGLDAKKLVSKLQTFCREEGEQFQSLSLVEVINDILPIVNNLLPQNIKLSFITDNHRELINADAAQLQQMLMILLKNAIKASFGHGNITIEVKKAELAEQICRGCQQNISGHYIALTIKDNGQGINAKYLPKLFLPFFTTHQMEGGTGMGLSVLHGMLHEHHGHILVTSEPEQGACFTLLFPIIPPNAVTEKLTTENTEQGNEVHKKAHILFVDDEQPVVDLFTEILEFTGYQVTAQTNVQSALALFMQAPDCFDLVIADQNMHGITGLMLIRAIKNVNPDIPTILISGNERAEFEQDITFIETVDGFLNKPFKTKQLQDLVGKLL